MKISQLDLYSRLSRAEYNVWIVLVNRGGRITAPDELYHLAMDYPDIDDYASDVNSTRNIIARLRKKVPENCIKTKRGAGYYFEDRELTEEEILEFS